MAAFSTQRGFLRAHRGGTIRVTAFVVVIAALVTGAIVAQGYDVKQAPLKSNSIWAINTSETQVGTTRYARINTKLGELDTVKPVAKASGLVQSATSAVLLANDGGKYATIDASDPQDFAAHPKDLTAAPTGTPTQIVSTPDWVGYRSQGGAIYVAKVGPTGITTPVAINPVTSDSYVSNEIAIGTTGVLYSYSSAAGSVVSYDLATGKALRTDKLTVPRSALDALQLTAVGDTWVLFDGAKTLWTGTKTDAATVTIPGATPVLQQPSADGDAVYLASQGGLFAVPLAGGRVTTKYTATGANEPAAPTEFDGTMYGAWLPKDGSSGAVLWSSAQAPLKRVQLSFAGVDPAADPVPVFRSNGGTMILNDDANGWVWTIPNGALVPSSQDWAAGDATSPQSDPSQQVAQDVTEPKPPVAVDDAFGVRPGQLVSLPVLLNDSDPNATDVLTVVPDEVTGLSAKFGAASVTTDDQSIAVRVADDATGTESFTYRVTDGVSAASAHDTATVTLTVVGDATETAPEWCGDDANGCVQTWPTLQVAAGGSASVTVLDQFVDPEGDAVYVSKAAKADPNDRGEVAVTPDGRVFFQDPDASSAGSGSVQVDVTVADSRGMTVTKALSVDVTAQPTLAIQPLAVTTKVGEKLTIDPSRYVSGVSGVYTITQAVPSAATAVSSVDSAGTGIDFSATAAGNYVVHYDLTDTGGQQASSTARVTVVAASDATLTTAPVTVFVRPNLDSTVDVFSAVLNPAGTLLVIPTDPVVVPASRGGATNVLTADAVGHGLLRVTGSTADGQPGLIGHVDYDVSDGSDDAGKTVHGIATVVLLPPQDEVAPVAVNDAVTVRASAQVDIPVLANDVAVDGGSMVLNPDPTALDYSGKAAGGLAFVSGSTVRFLAPKQAGSYTITYQVYAAGAPTKFGTGTVQVTVTKPGQNQAPKPRTLEARVVAGQSVSIPFDAYGVDPDGDSVVLDRISTQPKHGTATLGSHGDALTFTAVNGYSGSDQFDYQVKDPDGAIGTATVRVVIISTQTVSAPVTFTDYVEVQQGAGNVVDIYPALNDVDPLGKTLTVTKVQPFVRTGTQEYTDAQALIVPSADGSGVTSNRVQLRAGTVLGTRTFQYTVEDGLSPNVGYIVLNVVAASVPDVPHVSDSYVSVDDRGTFASAGLDVVTNKVTWASGDVANLAMSLVDPPAGYTVTGRSIAGPLPTGGSVLVAFKLTGTDSTTKKPVSSYGFLRIPGPDDILLSLRANAPQLSVKENGSPLSIAMADLVSVPTGATLQVQGTAIGKPSRPAATCTFASGTTVRYTPGAGAPYTDSCIVPVKFDFQHDYTRLLVPITIVPEKPVPFFDAASIPNLQPGTDVEGSIDLATMVKWNGPADTADLHFTIDKPTSKSFTTRLEGTKVFVAAKGGVPAGTRGVVTVHLGAPFASVAAGTISIATIAPPPSFPRGGSVSATCSLAAGKCAPVTVIGARGESNTVSGGALKVVASTGEAACTGISFRVVGTTQIQAVPGSTTDGVECDTSFVVQDPNKFKSSGDRNGTIHWTFDGLPRSPTSVTQVSYDSGRITLSVNPGKSSDAFPALKGFVIRQDSGSRIVATCSASGSCPPITGLTNLEHHRYSAFAINTKGDESTDAPAVEAWSYAKPSLGSVTTTPVADARLTTAKQGAVSIAISGSEKSVSGYQITGSKSTVPSANGGATITLQYDVGAQQIHITPVTAGDPPNAAGPTAADAADTYSVKVAGLPLISDYALVATDSSVTVTKLTVDANSSAIAVQKDYIAYLNAKPTCAVDGNGNLAVSGGDGVISQNPTIGGLSANRTYTIFACATNGFGLAISTAKPAFTTSVPPAPPAFTYTVAAGASTTGHYAISLDPAQVAPPADSGYTLKWSDSWNDANGPLSMSYYNRDPQITAAWCVDRPAGLGGPVCGPATTATSATPNATWEVSITGPNGKLAVCTRGTDLIAPPVSGTNGVASRGKATVTSFRYFHPVTVTGTDANGNPTTTTTSEPVDATGSMVPSDATSVDTVKATFTWNNGDPSVGGLGAYSWTAADAGESTDCHTL